MINVLLLLLYSSCFIGARIIAVIVVTNGTLVVPLAPIIYN